VRAGTAAPQRPRREDAVVPTPIRVAVPQSSPRIPSSAWRGVGDSLRSCHSDERRVRRPAGLGEGEGFLRSVAGPTPDPSLRRPAHPRRPAPLRM